MLIVKSKYTIVIRYCIVFVFVSKVNPGSQESSASNGPSTVYIRWGATSCPNSAEFVYEGEKTITCFDKFLKTFVLVPLLDLKVGLYDN